jgi:hypothetical protein
LGSFFTPDRIDGLPFLFGGFCYLLRALTLPEVDHLAALFTRRGDVLPALSGLVSK